MWKGLNMRKILIKILFKLLGYKLSVPILIDGSDFIIKFNNKYYIMTESTLKQYNNGKELLDIRFNDIMSIVDNKEKKFDFE